MLEVFVYLFAAYGLFCLVYFNLKDKFALERSRAAAKLPENEVFLVVKVQDVEQKIEGLVRECVKLGWSLGVPHRLVVINTGSGDQTGLILQRLANRYPYLVLERQPEAGPWRQVVVEFDPRQHPRQAAEMIGRAFKQEFSA